MGRSSRSSSPARKAPPAPMRRAPPPASVPSAPAPSAMTPMAPAPQQGGGMLAGMASTMMQGMAFGTGSTIARHAVESVMGGGGSSQQAPAVAPSMPVQAQNGGVCQVDMSAFNQCMQQNQGNIQNCDFYYQALQACQSNSRM